MKHQRISRDKLASEISSLGISKGDILFVASDLLQIGFFDKTAKRTTDFYLDLLHDLVGESGSLVFPSYSDSDFRYASTKKSFYHLESPTNSGSLPKALLQSNRPFKRGTHPTASVLVYGSYQEDILNSNTHQSRKYEVLSTLLRLKAKSLMLGIVDNKNSPYTFHAVQQDLGHTLTHPFANLFSTQYALNGTLKTHIVREIGGCTAGFHKAWGHLFEMNAASISRTGNAFSALVDGNSSYQIIRTIFKRDPGFFRCEDHSCVSCYGRYIYNGFGVVPFYFKSFKKLGSKLLRSFA